MFNPVLNAWKFLHGHSPILKKLSEKAIFSTFFLYSVLILCSCAGSQSDRKTGWNDSDLVNVSENKDLFVAKLDPKYQDLTSWKDMEPTLRKSMLYVNSKPQSGLAVSRPDLKVTWGELALTLRELQKILPALDDRPELLEEKFLWIPVAGGIAYSGYYEPRIRASRTRKKGYEHPIYMAPPELRRVRASGRLYHDRRTIETKKVLADRGLELAWAADPVDVFFLEIQGSGKLIFDDGSEAYVNYAGQNGHKYKSSGRIMREKGLLKRGDIFEQREWFRNNADRINEILHENPSFVFFKFGGRGPTGAMGHTVDDWLSLATDRKFIPLGSVVAYGVNIPDENHGTMPLRGIGFAQDVGGAIKKNRIDIFCGDSDRANYVASFLDARGPAWILLAKNAVAESY